MDVGLILFSITFFLLTMGFIFALLGEKIKRWDHIFYRLSTACGYLLVTNVILGILATSVYGMLKGFGLI